MVVLAIAPIALAGIALAAVTALVALGVSVESGALREPIARAMARSLGRPVGITGDARLVLSLRPAVELGGLRIGNPPGFDDEAFAVLGAARLEVDLLPLLRRRLVIRELSARDLVVRLSRRADGLGNWQRPDPSLPEVPETPAPPPDPRAAEDADARDAAGAFDASTVAAVRLERVRLERIGLRVVDARGHERRFDLDRLEASAGGREPLAVRVAGRVDEDFPYTLRIDGAPLAALVAPDGRWPFALALSFAGTEARVEGWTRGLVAPGPGGTQTDLGVTLASDGLAQLERLLQTRLPAVGATRLAFRVRQSASGLALDAIDGAMGATTIAGHLALDTRGAVPRLSGELALPTLDLRPFLGRPDSAPAPRSLLDTWRELAQTRVDLARLREFEADLTVTVGRWLSLPGDARDATLAVRVSSGRLVAPVQATVGGARLQGELLADASEPVPRLRLRLGTGASPLGALGELLTGIRGLEGELGRLDLALEGRGQTLEAIMRGLSARLTVDEARLTYGNVAGGRPVGLRLDRLEVALPSRGRLRGLARGALLDEPFQARLEGSDLDSLARDGQVRFDLQADASGARASLAGALRGLGASVASDAELSLRFSLAAARAGTVGRWLGLSPAATVPLDLRGRIEARPDRAHLSDLALRLGELRVTGEAGREGPAGVAPRIQARLAVGSIDVDELARLLPPRPPRTPTAGAFEAALRLPILPRGVPLADVAFDLALARGRTGAIEVEDLRLRGHLREGEIPTAPVAFTLARVPFAGDVSGDLRGALPQLRLRLATRALDAGALLARLGVAVGLDARVEQLQADATLRGATLADLLEHSSLVARVQGGHWVARSPTGVALARLALDRGELEVAAGQPLSLALAARIDRTPVDLRMRSGRLAQLVRPGSDLPFSLTATAAETTLALEGRAQAPLGRGGGVLALRAAGTRLDRLDDLARVSLPPWGPWSLSANLSAADAGYRLESLDVRSGSTRLLGAGSLALAGSRPRLDVDLRAPMLQLDDFRTAGWAATQRRAPASRSAADPATRALEEASAAAREGQRLMSRTTLLRQDAHVRVVVDEVRSGTDRLGGGEVTLRLDAGRLQLDPLRVAMPGGEARAALDYEPLPGDRDTRLRARVRIDRFDYGVLARRLQPHTLANGRFSVHADLAATAPLDQLLARGDGRIDLAVWPIDLRAGIFDLWAVNVFVAMLPALDPASASRINCAVGRFDLRDGQLREERLLVDSTRLRARGRARVDLRDGSLSVWMQPTPKQPQFFSLQTPVEVTGRIDDFRVGLPSGSIPATVARFVGSLVTTPIEWLLRDRLPADGADVCDAAMRSAAAGAAGLR